MQPISSTIWKDHHTKVARNDAFVSSFGRFKKLCKGCLSAALQAADCMEQQGTCIPIHVFYCLLQECINKKDLATGRAVYCLIKRSGLESNALLGSCLIRMFALCGDLFEANQLFNIVAEPNAFAWSAIISAYVKLGQAEHALKLYNQMQQSKMKPGYVFVAILKACAIAKALMHGKLIHIHMIESGFEMDIFVDNTLVDMYIKCGSLKDAHILFDDMPRRSVVTWTAMIAGYAQHGHGQGALQLFQKMVQEGMEPDLVTYVSMLKACSSMETLDQGKLIHSHVIASGFEMDVLIGSVLIDTYGKCGRVDDACKVFNKLPNRNLVTWSAMIAAYTHQGNGPQALQVFQQMQVQGIGPDDVTFVSVLKACSSIASLDQGMSMHAHILQSGFKSDLFIGNALIDMYAKCGVLESACKLFRELPNRDVVSWNTMIAGYLQHGHWHEAFRIFDLMQQEGVKPTIVTFVSILKACSGTAALDQAKLMHDCIIISGFDSESFVGNALIDIYIRCGSLEDACELFDKMQMQDVVAWSAIIGGYAQCNDFKLALYFFENMKLEGLKPNDVTFTCLLSACGHVGLVDEGFQLFRSMKDHGIWPMLDHYNCLVDILGRAGCLHEAHDLLQCMPFQFNVLGWMCLLSHCKTHGNVQLGRQCFEVIPLDCRDASGYVLMSDIYADADMWANLGTINDMKESKDVQRKPGNAFIEVDMKLHNFIVGDKSHPRSDGIYEKLKWLSLELIDGGYVPQSDFTWQPSLDVNKKDTLCVDIARDWL